MKSCELRKGVKKFLAIYWLAISLLLPLENSSLAHFCPSSFPASHFYTVNLDSWGGGRTHMWRAEDNLQESVLSFHLVGPRDGTHQGDS